ncbi:MAG: NADH-quinone oxidoreductase subunit M [Parachlamydiaceae bacterium]|nr:NADH-quinone oxidoreductase subunit M [Parachlamydiaceae bacterium]
MSHLVLLFIVPLIASLLAFITVGLSKKLFKRIACVLSAIPLAILLFEHHHWMGSEIHYDWIPALSIHFHLHVDGLSLAFLYLVAIITPISLLAERSAAISNPNVFYGLVLLVQGLLFGFFMARDLALFTLFWEAMLIPLYFIIALWGGVQRQHAALKFLIYMIVGSSLMVAAVLGLFFVQGSNTFNMDVLQSVAESAPYAPWICAIFLLAFAVKTPLFPFHAWLPDTYYQAPITGTILLSALLSKAGIYGIIRIGIGFFPTILQSWSPILIGLAITGTLYAGLAAWRQTDYKRLIAYSSLAHVNFILVGLFVWNEAGQLGATLQALNHGVTIAALFLIAGWLEDRLHSTAFTAGQGLAAYFPKLCWLTLFFVIASVALPGTNNFVGELLILYGLFAEHPWATAVLGTTVILSVIYMLRFMQKLYFETASPQQPNWHDIRLRELVTALPLVALILWVGIYPAPLMKLLETPTNPTVALHMELPR